ncbi:MAG: glycosyltransferase family 2 protein, partial [Candidatus Heimdallarchaeota archaeon]
DLRYNSFFMILTGIMNTIILILISNEYKIRLYNYNKLKNLKESTELEERKIERVAVIIPAFNEEKLILRTLKPIPKIITDIYVVDDGSKDHTGDIVAEYSENVDSRVKLVIHEVNSGVGSAIMTGYQAAYDDNCDIFIVIGGDAQMEMADLPHYIEAIKDNKGDYIKGNRFIYGRMFEEGNALKNMPKLRIFGNIVLSFITLIHKWVTHLYIEIVSH